MLYRLFLFKPKYRRIMNMVYWTLNHYATEEFSKDAAKTLEKFDAETVKEELENAFFDRAKVYISCLPQPYEQVSFLRIVTSFDRIKEIMPEIMAGACRYGLTVWDGQTYKAFRTDDYLENSFIDGNIRGKQLTAAIRQAWCKKEIWEIREVDTEVDHPAVLHFVIRLRKSKQVSFPERVSELYGLLQACMLKNEKLICRNQSFIIEGESYSVTFYLEGYKRANQIGFIEDGEPQVSLIHRMGYDEMSKWLHQAKEEYSWDTLYRLNCREYRNEEKNILDDLAANIQLTKKLMKLPYQVAIGPIRKPYGGNICFHVRPEEDYSDEKNRISMFRIDDCDAVIIYRFILDICPFLQDRCYDTTYLPLEYLDLIVKRLQTARDLIVKDPFDEQLTPYFKNKHYLPLDKKWIEEHRWDVVKLFDTFNDWAEAQLNRYISEERTLVIFGP